MGARHYRRGRLGGVDLLVVHTAEGARSARGLGAYFAGTDRRASAHAGVDNDERVDYVRPDDTAYAAPGANADGEHLELCGFAAWSRDTWVREHSPMLDHAARWVADRAAARGLPLVLLGPDELVRDGRGITTHDAVTRAFRRSTHTDPGRGFPLDVLLDRARALTAGLAAHREAAPAPRPAARLAPPYPGRPVRPGSRGAPVLVVQRRLRQRGWRLAVDGIYGTGTGRTVVAFQRDSRLSADGIVGPRTWHALWHRPITP